MPNDPMTHPAPAGGWPDKRSALLDLASRVERAAAFAESALIWEALGALHLRSTHQHIFNAGALVEVALAMVPEGWRLAYMGEWDAECLRAKGPWQAILIRPGEGDFFGPDLSPRCNHAASLALALCAASLRALAQPPAEADHGGS